MPSKTPKTQHELAGAMQSLVDNPESYNQFIDAWHKHISAEIGDIDELVAQPNQSISNQNVSIGGVENVAEETLAAIAVRDHDNEFNDDIARMLNSFPHAAFLVSTSGVINSLNDLAYIENKIDTGSLITDTKYTLESSQSLIEVINTVVSQGAGARKVLLKRGYNATGKRVVTFAFILSEASERGEPRVLIFVVDPVWRKEAGVLMQNAFGFTNAESNIVDGFMAGETLREIASHRERSHATVRTQFQNLMEKAGAKTQLELMRIALGLSQFVGEIQPMAKAALRPQRKRVDVLRPGNRSVDVLFYGDPEGKPVVYMHSIFFRAFPSLVEFKLRAAGLKFIAIGRPGFGTTSAPLEGQDKYQCTVDDVEAVLDQMGIDQFTVLGQAAGTPAIFALCNRLSSRIIRAVSIGSAVPALPVVALDTNKIGSTWTAALIKASKVSPKIAYLVAKAGYRLMQSSGTYRFFSRHYNASPSDVAVLNDPDVIREFEDGMEFISHQGIENAVDDVMGCFDNWVPLVEAAKTKITFAHGTQDPHAPIHAIKAFCQQFPKKAEMHEIPHGGQLLMLSHTDEIIKLLKGDLSLKKAD